VPKTTGPESSASDARREHLQAFIQTHEFVRIYDLARQFGVSEVTIRSDVDILARRRRHSARPWRRHARGRSRAGSRYEAPCL
jgi:predicted ArsR family transcriptional regulator